MKPNFADKNFMDTQAFLNFSDSLFVRDLEGLAEVFDRMSAGMSSPKLLLWADSSFLSYPA